MGKIILARHGQCKDNEKGIFNGTRDSELTVQGIHQADELATNLSREFNIGHIFCSPKRRAKETGMICTAPFWNVRLSVLDFLVERNHGILEGRLHSEVPVLAKRYFTHQGFDYILEAEGAETYPQLYERARQVYLQMMYEVVKLPSHKDVLFVGHGTLFKMVEVVHYGRPWESIWDNPWWRNCEYRVLTKPD